MRKLEYALSEISEHYQDKFWWRDRFFHRVIGPFHTGIYPTRRGAIDVMDEDWDTLVVLDACRSDLFEEVVDTDEGDSYRRVISRGSATKEWVIQNFTGEEFGDTVYVTANPYVSRETSRSFHELYEPWLSDFDENEKTVLPEVITDIALRAHEEHPEKRVIVHYMQPHHPFIGAPDFQDHGWQIEEFEDWTEKREETGLAGQGTRPHTPWDALYMGLVKYDDVWSAYRRNLELAMDAVKKLISQVNGKVVVTSDHGNMLGERTWPIPLRVYGHPSGVRNEELVEIPWLTFNGESRRTITAEGTTSSENAEHDELEERLSHLGYR